VYVAVYGSSAGEIAGNPGYLPCSFQHVPTAPLQPARVPHGVRDAVAGKRDVRIDWLRGLAMTCVIINHSRLSSPLSWFSYERFWVVTAAEVFVVLSGVVIGMVYRKRIARDGWGRAVRSLGRRAALLYASFVGVTASVLALAAIGMDVSPLMASDGHTPTWFIAPHTMTPAEWSDVLLMRVGPWAFEIIGLYVWLVALAAPCLLLLQRSRWRALLAVSWGLYLWYRIQPHALTFAGFESSFPILAWQLLFVHGVTLGYHRDDLRAFAARMPALAPRLVVIATAGFALFAFCNPWTDGPSWLQLRLVSPDRFAELYHRYFTLSDLGVGRLLNIALGLPVGYALLPRLGMLVRPLEPVLVTLGRRSLGAFIAHVYGLLLLAHAPARDSLWMSALLQIGLVLSIAAILSAPQLLRRRPPRPVPLAPIQSLAA
jgi:hypothetical protein